AENTVSFDFSKFLSGQENLILQGDTVTDDSNRCLVLTRENNGRPVQDSVGRVLYQTPIHLWDKQIDKEASFETSFTFFIYRENINRGGDGITFFLAPTDTQPKSGGGYLGIFKDAESNETVVAVEFDTFSNRWDPANSHIGINVNSVKSKITTPWGLKNDYFTVTITYDATRSLSVSSFYRNKPDDIFTVKASVHLRDALPQWVRIGLSAATGDLVEQHRLYSWSFKSVLPLDSST
uniref:Lectin n=1 Tax=Onobrychis viciifolia TaxID=3882 RepID=LEC_ONOVI|nr:RecName: Full=Lectin [Onobrychis viciifolia]